MKNISPILQILTITCFMIFVVSCKQSSRRVKLSHESSKFVGVWEGTSKPLGGQGIIEIKIELKTDSSFVMHIKAGEKAHVLNPYPTLDEIEMMGEWSFDGEREILMDGEIKRFNRKQMIGNAAQHGFLSDDRQGIYETDFIPLPLDDKLTLSVGQNGELSLGSIAFKGRKAGKSSDSLPSSRLIYSAILKRADSH